MSATPVLVGTLASSSTTPAITTTADIPAGSMILVCVGASATSGTLDSGGDANNGAASYTVGDSGNRCRFAYKPNSAFLASGSTINLGFSNSSTRAIAVFYIPDVIAASPLDKNVSKTTVGSGTSDSQASGTLAQAPEIVVSMVGSNAALSGYASTGFTTVEDGFSNGANTGIGVAYQVVLSSTSTVTDAASWTGSNSGAEHVTATFKLQDKGTLSATLGGVTGTKTGTVKVQGSLSKTLGAVTISAAGTAGGGVTGTLSKTLGAIAAAATGTVKVQGALSQALGAITGTKTGTVKVQGGLSKTLGAIAGTGTGTVKVLGSLSQTLGSIDGTRTGAVKVQGSLAQALGAISIAATGGSGIISGALSQTLGSITGTETGTVKVQGVLALTLGAVTGVAAGAGAHARRRTMLVLVM